MHWLQAFWWWVEVHTGTVNESGPYYGFFSGFGSDIAEVAILGGVFQLYRKHNCHVKGCWRIGKHPFKHFTLCSKHHPGVPEKITHEHIKRLHKRDKLSI